MIKAKAKPRPADTQRVKPYVERVKALMLEQKAIGSDVTDVCREAKEVAGLDRDSYFAAIKARRLLGLLRAEFWPIEGDEFDLVLAAALAGLP